MRIIFLVSIFTLIFGCKNSSDTFQTIDYSFFSDPANIFSIKILNDGRAHLYTYNKYWNAKYYHDFNLDKAMSDSINKLTGLILKSKFDTTYSLGCVRCLNYCLIIKTNKRTFKVTYGGQLFADKSLILLDRLARNIHLIVKNRETSMDSIYRFESWSKYLLPPPPPCDSCDYETWGKEYLPNYH
jgi:hypothetical protein